MKDQPAGKLESRWITVDGLRLHTVVSSASVAQTEGRLVLLVHGLSVSSRYMIPTAERLATRFQVHAPDLPGFGKSDKPEPIFDVGDLADALIGYMDAMGIENAPMLANSLGCQIVVDVALRYPERLPCAILIGPTVDPQGRTLLQQAWRLLLDSFREAPTEPIVVFFDYAKAGLRRTVQTMQLAIDYRVEDKLPDVDVPVLVVRGGRDPIVPQRWAAEFARLLPRGRLAVIPGAAHAVNYSAPDELMDVAMPFLLGDLNSSVA